MIGQLKTLLRVKQLKEDQALRTMQKKRQDLRDAQIAVDERRGVMEESRRTLRAREDAIYQEIIGTRTNVDGIEETKAKVLRLEADHQILVDDVERARHVMMRIEKELQEATNIYNKCVKDRDKYQILTTEVGATIAAELGLAEENEIEDLFSRKREQPA
jgi:hypothetical protein